MTPGFGAMPSDPALSADQALERLVQFVTRASRLFVLTGAGCSTDSGIPAYRDAEGRWSHRPPVQYADFVG
jgi:NAD-dependent SIR2 family protein deacetylase